MINPKNNKPGGTILLEIQMNEFQLGRNHDLMLKDIQDDLINTIANIAFSVVLDDISFF